MVDLADLIHRYAARQITGHIVVEARSGSHANWPEWVPPEIRHALQSEGIEKPWTHQVLIGELLQLGQHAVLATGTGSGKSLAVWLPVISELFRFSHERTSLKNINRRPSTLYLAPTKALSKDQENVLTRICEQIFAVTQQRANLPLFAAVDGDTDSVLRAWGRDYADIIFSNPDFVHYALLSNHEQWARFLRSLSVIVVDEFHHYRGNFGSNVSLILRRLLRLAHHYGAVPKVVFLSATSPNPEDTAQRFLGGGFGKVFGVSEDGSPRGRRDIFTILRREIPEVSESAQAAKSQWEIDFADPEAEALGSIAALESSDGIEVYAAAGGGDNSETLGKQNPDSAAEDPKRRSAVSEAGELTAELVTAGAQILTFVRSRAAAERVAEIARQHLNQGASHLAGAVGAYRGGYLPEERRALEAGLRDGDIRGLATTSALELGIDISGLDAVVVTGWPGTNASFQQQIGRSGRSGANGVAVFIGRDNPLDQYILENPQLLIQTPAETNVFDPHNPWILPSHLCAAAAELPLTEQDIFVFDLENTKLFQQLASQDLLKQRPKGWYWNTSLKVRAHDLADIRGEANTLSIIDHESGVLLGTVSQGQADTTVYPGAIYLHQGKPFKVDMLEPDAALVHPHREEEIRTYARERTAVRIERIDAQQIFANGILRTGAVRVENQVVGYDVRRFRDGMYLGYVPLEMPIREFSTGGTWFSLDAKLLSESGVSTAELPGALHAAEHTLIGLLPLFAVCDRWDLGGLSAILHPDTGAPTVIIHDSAPGGSGCALHGFTVFPDWVRAALDVLGKCSCQRGCPRCVQSPKCGNNNEPLSKSAAKRLLEILLTQIESAEL
ncbi:DEAD/DEAH box helicase [Arcanobacterium hippocoleae]